MGPKRTSIVGRRYGRLVVTAMQADHVSQQHVQWQCACDCGSIVVRSRGTLRGAISHHTSCGCRPWRGGHDYTTALRTQAYRTHSLGAHRRQWSPLSREAWNQLVTQPCSYCGQTDCQQASDGSMVYLNGVDRLDSTKGYQSDNVVPCCGRCNRMKLTSLPTDFLSHVETILNHLDAHA